jgi:hypothetical protein
VGCSGTNHGSAGRGGAGHGEVWGRGTPVLVVERRSSTLVVAALAVSQRSSCMVVRRSGEDVAALAMEGYGTEELRGDELGARGAGQ